MEGEYEIRQAFTNTTENVMLASSLTKNWTWPYKTNEKYSDLVPANFYY